MDVRRWDARGFTGRQVWYRGSINFRNHVTDLQIHIHLLSHLPYTGHHIRIVRIWYSCFTRNFFFFTTVKHSHSWSINCKGH
jgi:hypothetical protein